MKLEQKSRFIVADKRSIFDDTIGKIILNGFGVLLLKFYFSFCLFLPTSNAFQQRKKNENQIF